MDQFAITTGNLEAASFYAQQARAVWRALGDPRGEAEATHHLAMVEEHRFQWRAAAELYQDELAVWRQLQEPLMIGRVVALLGGVAYGDGNFDHAIELVDEASKLFREIGDRHWAALCAWYLGMFANAREQWRQAAGFHQESLRTLTEIGDSVWRFKPLTGLAAVAAAIGHHEDAARLLGAVDASLLHTGARLLPFDQPMYQQAESAARASLGEAGFANAHASGCDLSTHELLGLAGFIVAVIETREALHRPKSGAVETGLTTREHEILNLVAKGQTDREIAEALFLSRRTVNAHVANILAKLGVSTRRDATALARARGWLTAGDFNPQHAP